MPSALLKAQDTGPPHAQRTDPRPRRLPRPAVWALALLLLAGGCGLAWGGGAAALSGAALTAAAGWLACAPVRHSGLATLQVAGPGAAPQGGARGGAATGRPGGPGGPGGRVGPEVMIEAVVPVWSRQMDVTREAAAEGLAHLLNTFSELSGALHTLTENLSSYTLSAEPGAVDQAVRRESPALDELCAASQRAFAERDQAVGQLGTCAEGLQRLGALAKQTRELARQTRMMAFNASIEANRSRTQTDGATQAVASEARALAERMAHNGEQIDAEVTQLLDSVRSAQRHAEVTGTSPEELRIEIDLQARKALAAMLGSLGQALQNSTEVQQAGQTLKDQLDAAFVHFQFGDRVSQMLAIVGNDMTNFAKWVSEHPHATQTDAAQWLAALEASYTMDEQRSSHHGNVHVQQGSGVEFF